MRFSWKTIFLFAALAIAVTGQAQAQNGIVAIERVDGLISGNMVQAGANLRFLIRHTNNTGEKTDVTNGYRLSSPDGAVWDSTSFDSIGPVSAGKATYFLPFFDVVRNLGEYDVNGVSPDTVGIIAAGNAALQMPTTWNDTVYAITAWFNGNTSAAGKTICIDSSFFGTGGEWLWASASLNAYYPEWHGLPGQPHTPGLGYCFQIYAPSLDVDQDSLGFNAVPGGANPPAQIFNVASNGDGFGEHLNFTLIEGSPWLQKSPSTGTTPRAVSVSVNITGLAPGLYVDSIRVESPAAVNSPQWVKVTLSVQEPPPTIFVSRSSFFFAAITGGSNPAPQTFAVKNVGGNTLNWTLSKTSTWLSLSPSSGVDSQLVTVSADITGLILPEYFDTIVVTDPAATNSPVRIPVKLSLGSSLPQIAVDSALNHIIVDAPNDPPDRKIYIYNAGIGPLTYTIGGTTQRIWTVTPNSGSAPESVTVRLKILGSEGQEFWDTLWVSSPEATNSPFPVVFHSRVVEEPASLACDKDSIFITSYGCPEPFDVPAFDSFTVYNTGDDFPKTVTATLESDLVSVTPASGLLHKTFVVSDLAPDIPTGVYYDTISLSTQFAYNSPLSVIVKYTRLVESPPADLGISRTEFSVPIRKGQETKSIAFRINNLLFGCMPWSLEEEIDWLTADIASGNVPSTVTCLLDAETLARGAYTDSIMVTAPLDPGGPEPVRVTLKVWVLRGDMNWDGRINSLDLMYMIKYLTTGSPLPQPTNTVGDVDCSGPIVNALDLTRLIHYLLKMATICTNP